MMSSSPSITSTPSPSPSSAPKSTSSSDTKTGLVGLEGFKNSPTVFTTATGKEIGNIGYQARLYFELSNSTSSQGEAFSQWANRYAPTYGVSDVEYHLHEGQDLNEKTCEVRLLYKSRSRFDDMINNFLENESWCKSLLAGCLSQQKFAPIDSVALHTVQNGTVCTHPTEVLYWKWGSHSFSSKEGTPQEPQIEAQTSLTNNREEVKKVEIIDLTLSDDDDDKSELTYDFGSTDSSGTSFNSSPPAKKQKTSH